MHHNLWGLRLRSHSRFLWVRQVLDSTWTRLWFASTDKGPDKAENDLAKKFVEGEVDKKVEAVWDEKHGQTKDCVGGQDGWGDNKVARDIGDRVRYCAEYVQKACPNDHECYVPIWLVDVDGFVGEIVWDVCLLYICVNISFC